MGFPVSSPGGSELLMHLGVQPSLTVADGSVVAPELRLYLIQAQPKLACKLRRFGANFRCAC